MVSTNPKSQGEVGLVIYSHNKANVVFPLVFYGHSLLCFCLKSEFTAVVTFSQSTLKT